MNDKKRGDCPVILFRLIPSPHCTSTVHVGEQWIILIYTEPQRLQIEKKSAYIWHLLWFQNVKKIRANYAHKLERITHKNFFGRIFLEAGIALAKNKMNSSILYSYVDNRK